MTWYALRTKPGAQKPQREYKVEDTSSRKGYRIVPSLDANVSAIERVLTQAGIQHYMPAEKRLIRDRRHTDLWKPRRFALLVGYVFIKGPVDWWQLSELPGVHSVVGINGKPLEIDLLDIMHLRSQEAVIEEEFDRDARRARKTLKAKARDKPWLKKLAAKLDAADELTMAIELARAS
jgi:transcription antitermination factor NusG